MNLPLLFSEPLIFLAWLLALAIALSVHEFSHALAAYLLGDSTAERAGRLTLNPVAHLDLWGTLLLVLAGFGWGKPVPVNPYNLRLRRWGNTVVSLAGPGANLLAVLLFGLGLRFAAVSLQLTPDNLLVQFLLLLIQINLVLLLFNLLPIPPLDGSKFLLEWLPARYDSLRDWLVTKGPMALLVLVVADSFLGLRLFSRLFGFAFRLVLGVIGV